MQKYVMEGWMAPAEGMGLGVTGKHVYLADDVDALLTKLSHARLTWAMACECKCQACAEIDDTLKDLVGRAQ